MKLNRIEKALMNNPVRALVQRHREAALMERFGGRVDGARVLEIGCGRGVGTEIIFERFGAREVHAFDVDPDMIARAQKRLSVYPAKRLTLFVGDAAAITAEDNSYDAVFDFGIIHHVSDWHRAVAEVARVLKPGGRFFFEEVTRHALDRWFYRTFLDHPKTNRFNAAEFIAELERQGLIVGGNQNEWFFGDFVIGVGRRLSGVNESQLENQTNQKEKTHEEFSYTVNGRVNFLAMFALTLVAGLAFAFSSTQAAHDPAEHIREVLMRSATALERNDMAAMEKTWANDDSVTVFESGHANYGWQDYRDHHLGPEMKEMKNTKYSLSDIKAKVSGNTAWATFKYSISADVGTRHVDGAGLGTAVLEKRGEDWRIVHWHSSAPRRSPAPAASPAKK